MAPRPSMANIPVRIGSVRAWLLDCGGFPYDGGVLFGAVPRAAWQSHYTPDSQHRVRVAARPLLVEAEAGYILVDTGLPHGEPGGRPVTEALGEVGVVAEDITAVVLTHLHPDHVGGNLTARKPEPVAAFPNALYHVQRDEVAAAAFPNERTRADYEDAGVDLLQGLGRLNVVVGRQRLDRWVTLLPAPGHTPGQQCVSIVDGDAGALYVTDLAIFPVQAERFAWISAIDTHPMRSLESKRALLGLAAELGWLLLFEHEPEQARAVGRLETHGRRWRYVAGA
jgi:glyoxylase-like metal-dependent hydrolase (beta-lactamase superfamily II)